MSQSSDVVIVDIGSESICAYSAERLSDDNFAVKDSCWTEYSGYMDGKWLKPEEVIPSITELLEKIEHGSGKIKTLYVGIPADFCVVRTIADKVVFPKPKRVTVTDIAGMYESNDPFRNGAYTRLHASAVYFLTDKGERTVDPIGSVTSYLKGQLSYIGANSAVLSFLKQGIVRYGVKTVRFIQSEYAAAMDLFSPEERDAGVLFADVGYLSTSVLYVGGEALLEMRTFALGGSMIPMGLANALEIPFPVATALTSKINLAYKEEGEYTLRYDTSSYTFPVEQVNGIARECIRCIVGYIRKAIGSFRFETSPTAPLFMTGGGFSNIRCAGEYVSKCFGSTVEMIQPSAPNFTKPCYSTTVGLLRSAFSIAKQERFGFIKRIFGI